MANIDLSKASQTSAMDSKNLSVGFLEEQDPTTKGELSPFEQKAKDAMQNALKEAIPFHETRRKRWTNFYNYYRSFHGRPFNPAHWGSQVFIPQIFQTVESYRAKLSKNDIEFTVDIVDPQNRGNTKWLNLCVADEVRQTKLNVKKDDMAFNSLVFGRSIISTYYKTETSMRYLPNFAPTEWDIDYDQQEVTTYDGNYVKVWDPEDVILSPYCREDVDSWPYVIIRTIEDTDKVREFYKDKFLNNGQYVKDGGDLTDWKAYRREIDEYYNKLYHVLRYPTDALTTVGDASRTNLPKKNKVELYYFYTDQAFGVMTGDGLPLRWGPNPYMSMKNVFSKLDCVRVPGDPDGMGIPEIMEQSVLVRNMLLNQAINNLNLTVNKMFLVQENAVVDRSQLVARPFGLIEVRTKNQPLANTIQELQTTDIKQSVFSMDALLDTMGQKASGANDYVTGTGKGQSSDTATEATLLAQSGNDRIDAVAMNLERQTLPEIGMRIASNIQQFWTSERVIQVTGDDGIKIFKYLPTDDPQAVLQELQKGYDDVITPSRIAGEVAVRVKAGTLMPPNKEAMRALELQFFNLIYGTVSAQNLQVITPGQKKAITDLCDAFDKSNPEQYFELPPAPPMQPGMPAAPGAAPVPGEVTPPSESNALQPIVSPSEIPPPVGMPHLQSQYTS